MAAGCEKTDDEPSLVIDFTGFDENNKQSFRMKFYDNLEWHYWPTYVNGTRVTGVRSLGVYEGDPTKPGCVSMTFQRYVTKRYWREIDESEEKFVLRLSDNIEYVDASGQKRQDGFGFANYPDFKKWYEGIVSKYNLSE